jgi:hypothetical protein
MRPFSLSTPPPSLSVRPGLLTHVRPPLTPLYTSLYLSLDNYVLAVSRRKRIENQSWLSVDTVMSCSHTKHSLAAQVEKSHSLFLSISVIVYIIFSLIRIHPH